MRHVALTILSLAVVLGTAACKPGTADSPQQITAPSTTAPHKGNDPALAVRTPKNLNAITDACTLLKPEQLTQLHAGTRGEPRTTTYGETSCTWNNDDFAATASAIGSRNYGPERIKKYTYTRGRGTATNVDGYPGARVDDAGTLCRVEIGVNPTQAIAVNYTKFSGTEPEMQNGCGYAERIASAALRNIPDA